MARRGEELRRHILWTAKDVFLQTGFERASMDVVAARAETSKRSLYAHFESKDKLFVAVVDLVRELYLGRLGTPGDYAPDTAEAAVLFCGRFLQLQLWEQSVRTVRLGIAEAERLPQAAAQLYDAVFEATAERLAAFLAERCALTPEQAGGTALALLGRTVHPRLFRVLLGVDQPLPARPEESAIAADVDLAPIREAARLLLPADA